MSDVRIALDGRILRVYSGFDMKETLAGIGCGVWSKKTGAWEFPGSAVLLLVRALRKAGANVLAQPPVHALAKEWAAKERWLAGVLDEWHARVRCKMAGTPKEEWPDTLPAHPFLMYHQRMGAEIADRFDAFALFNDTGTGKTLMALEIIKRHGPNKFMVITPKTLIKSAWLDDQRDWYPALKLLPLSRNMSRHDYTDIAARWGVSGGADDLRDWADAYVINPESFKRDVAGLPPVGGMILDESTLVRNRSDTTTEITKYADALHYRYIMTGKPNVNGLMNYFGQMRVVDPAVLGRSFFAFRARYFETRDRFGYVWTPKPGAADEIAALVATRSIDVRKEECLDLPERTFIVRHVELAPGVMKQYKQLERDALLMLEDTLLTAPMKLTLMGKLRQFTGGHVITDDGPMPVHNSKLAALQEVLDEFGDKQVIIWAQYKHEIATIAQHLSGNGATVVTANSETADVDEDIAAFKTGEAQYMVAHPRSLKFGVTFIKCDACVYYSKSHDYEEAYQSADRIYRKGQVNACTYVSLVVPGTIDEDIERAVQNKSTAATTVESMIARARGA